MSVTNRWNLAESYIPLSVNAAAPLIVDYYKPLNSYHKCLFASSQKHVDFSIRSTTLKWESMTTYSVLEPASKWPLEELQLLELPCWLFSMRFMHGKKTCSCAGLWHSWTTLNIPSCTCCDHTCQWCSVSWYISSAQGVKKNHAVMSGRESRIKTICSCSEPEILNVLYVWKNHILLC